MALRLADRLSPNPVLIHVDSAAPSHVWDAIATGTSRRAHVELLPRRRTAWASWELVEAATAGLERALRRHPEVSHVLLLSGQDYPLVPAAQISQFLASQAGQSFIPNWRLPSALWGARGGMDRVRDFNFRVGGRRVRFRGARKTPPGLTLFGGSMYWILSREGGADVLHNLRTRPDWTRFLSRSWIPDELAIPSVALSGEMRSQVVNENLSLIQWSNPGSAHPDVLSLADVETLTAAASGPSSVGGNARIKLFARKMDETRSAELLDWIDHSLLGVEVTAGS